MPVSNPPISVRISPGERELLELAAQSARTNLSDFVRRKALEAAEMELMEQRVVTIPAADWERFEQWVQKPGKPIPALAALAAGKSAWQD